MADNVFDKLDEQSEILARIDKKYRKRIIYRRRNDTDKRSSNDRICKNSRSRFYLFWR